MNGWRRSSPPSAPISSASPTAEPDLFARDGAPIPLAPGALILPGFALPAAETLLAGIAAIAGAAPFRHMETPGGRRLSAAMTNAGLGWVTDRRGYRYAAEDPAGGAPWPAIPAPFLRLAADAARAAGHAGFVPDACLVNRYAPGARMGLHQDRDEADLGQPIVSVSLGLPAVFLWAGESRTGRPRRARLAHGDVVVWGGPSRLAFHGVAPVEADSHAATGAFRYNLTFRRAR